MGLAFFLLVIGITIRIIGPISFKTPPVEIPPIDIQVGQQQAKPAPPVAARPITNCPRRKANNKEKKRAKPASGCNKVWPLYSGGAMRQTNLPAAARFVYVVVLLAALDDVSDEWSAAVVKSQLSKGIGGGHKGPSGC
jgi:hypothetical protein